MSQSSIQEQLLNAIKERKVKQAKLAAIEAAINEQRPLTQEGGERRFYFEIEVKGGEKEKIYVRAEYSYDAATILYYQEALRKKYAQEDRNIELGRMRTDGTVENSLYRIVKGETLH